MVVAREVSLEAAHRLDAALAFSFLASEIGARLEVYPAACDRDHVQRAIQLLVATTVEPVTVVSPRGHRIGAARRSRRRRANLWP